MEERNKITKGKTNQERDMVWGYDCDCLTSWVFNPPYTPLSRGLTCISWAIKAFSNCEYLSIHFFICRLLFLNYLSIKFLSRVNPPQPSDSEPVSPWPDTDIEITRPFSHQIPVCGMKRDRSEQKRRERNEAMQARV